MADNSYDPRSGQETESSQNRQSQTDPVNPDNRSTDDYDPNKVYNYNRAHTEPERDYKGHPLPPQKKKANNLATIALACSIATIFLCCCSPYSSILSAIMGLTLGICSRYFNNDEKRWYPQAIAAIILSIILLLLILGSIMLTYVLFPYLMEISPEFKEYYEQASQLMMETLEKMAEAP